MIRLRIGVPPDLKLEKRRAAKVSSAPERLAALRSNHLLWVLQTRPPAKLFDPKNSLSSS
jgi:hypothetical protein